MRPLIDMDTIQIEITNSCILQCSNCTRFCGHFKKPFFLSMDEFKTAVDSMEKFPKMVGIMGGEPLLHPQFAEFCEYILSKIPRERLGLWTAFPKGKEYYREVICKTFGNIFLNDHTRGDIFHQPLLVSAEELRDKVMNEPHVMDYFIDKCWIQNAWSAAINPNGAFFCEVAAAWSLLLGETAANSKGWTIEPGWWWRTSKDFREQIDAYCHRCGGAMPLIRRASTDIIDDISPKNLALIKDTSPKVQKGLYEVHNLGAIPFEKQQKMAMYKIQPYRDRIAERYRIFVRNNERGFNEPFLVKEDFKLPDPLFTKIIADYKEYVKDGGIKNA